MVQLCRCNIQDDQCEVVCPRSHIEQRPSQEFPNLLTPFRHFTHIPDIRTPHIVIFQSFSFSIFGAGANLPVLKQPGKRLQVQLTALSVALIFHEIYGIDLISMKKLNPIR